jgi:hypothetical protein
VTIEIDADANLDQRASLISSLLDDEPAEPAAAEDAPEHDSPAVEADDPGPAEEPVTEADEADDAAPADPETPVIEPPASWSAEHKERFRQLPPDLQAVIAEREAEQKSAFNRQINEAAEKRKAAEAEFKAAQSERQRYAQQLDHALTLATSADPDIATAAKMTPAQWAQLAAENPGEHVRLQAKVQQLAALQQERQHLAAQSQAEAVQRETAALIEAMPELKDPQKAKAFAKDVDDTLKGYGFTAQELAGISDHRIFQVVRDAIAYRKGEAARKAAAAKVTKPVPKVQKPGTGERAQPARNEAILKRAARATSLHDRAELLAQLID